MRRVIATCSVVLLAVALFGVCGSSAKTGSSSSDTTTSSGGSGSSSNDEFSKLYAEAAKAKFKVTFTNNDGESSTYAQDGTGNSVYSTSDSALYTTSKGSVTCNDLNTTPKCISTSVGGAVNGFLTIFNAARTYIDVLGKYGDTSSKTIAGRDAKCVEFSKDTVSKAGVAAAAVAQLIKGSLTYCLDKDTGVLLSFSTTDANGKTTDSFTVTKFSEPTAADFTPPATPETVPSVSIPNVSIPTITYPPGYTGPTIPGGG